MNYFTPNDFLRATPKCEVGDMDSVFLHKLDVARFHSGVPFIVNSAYRSKEYELSKGRDGTSSHTKGVAVDLKAVNSRTRFKIIEGLRKAGFTRIGIGEDFIHVDDDPDKDQSVMWTYYNE